MGSKSGPERLIRSADASTIIDSTSADFVRGIQQRLSTPQWHLWGLGAGLSIFVIGGAIQVPGLAIFGAIAMTVGGIAGYVVYSAKRITEVHYELDDHYDRRYSALLAGFERLRLSQRLWSVQSTSSVHNRKYHAGASSLLGRTGATATMGAPRFLRVNRKVPTLRAGPLSIYFLPDTVLLVQGRKVGAVSYPNLRFSTSTTQFIEDGFAPSDSQQVGTTWRYVNKSGGPDRRFSNNRQLPILKYAELKLQSDTGLNTLIHASNVECAARFVRGLSSM